MQVFDINGKILAQEKIKNVQTAFDFDCSKLPNALYFAKLIDDNETQVLPFVVNR
jgi:hypothetical protein